MDSICSLHDLTPSVAVKQETRKNSPPMSPTTDKLSKGTIPPIKSARGEWDEEEKLFILVPLHKSWLFIIICKKCKEQRLKTLREVQPKSIQDLPPEVSLMIFSKLDVLSLSRALQTCKEWNDLIEDSDSLWKNHCSTKDRQEGLSWKDMVRYHHAKNNWMKGMYSYVRSADQIPPNRMFFDMKTWGEILEAELKR